MRLGHKSIPIVLVHFSHVRRDPHLVEGVHRDIGRAEFRVHAAVDLIPELAAKVFFRIHQSGRYLLEDIVLRQHVATRVRMTEIIGHDTVVLNRRKVDPQLLFRHSEAGQEIFHKLGGLIGQSLTFEIRIAVINDKIE